MAFSKKVFENGTENAYKTAVWSVQLWMQDRHMGFRLNVLEIFQPPDKTAPTHFGGIIPRFAAILLLFVLAVLGRVFTDYAFPLPSILLLLLISTVANFGVLFWITQRKGIRFIPYFAASLDIVLITFAVHYLGGIEAPIVWIYAVCIMTVALVHGFKMSIYSALLCSLLYSALLIAESAGFIKQMDFGLVNPVYLTGKKGYLYIKLICDNCLFAITALISGFMSEQLIRSKEMLEGQNARLETEVSERVRAEEELRRHREELEDLVAERTSALTETVSWLRQQVAERKQIEDMLRENEEKYRLHFENVSDVIFSIDRNLRIISVSPSVERFLGYPPKTLLGKTFDRLNILGAESVKRAVTEVARVLSGERISAVEHEFIAADGKRKLAAVSGDPVYKNGDIVAMISVARDITQQKELERQFFQAQKMESVGTLAGGIAHDFNNLLSGILGYASLMKARIARDNQLFSYISTIEKSAARASELVAQLLAFSRGGKYELKAVNLNGIVKDTLEIIRRTFDKSIEVEARLSGHLPTVVADGVQMEQILMNLCINARDAMPNGGKLIVETDVALLSDDYVKTHLGAKPGTYALLSVSDNGVGMSREIIEKVFEPFFTTKEKGKGTGLGLAMVYGVVKNHGGSVQVYSEPGLGTTFKIYLPVDGRPEKEEDPRSEMPETGNELILVVDDEQVILSLARDMLQAHGYDTLLAESGEEAIDLYSKHGGRISLVILDMVMPRMGGLETFLELKKLDPKVRAILSTGYSQNDKAQEILNHGARGFLQKPYQVNTLLSKVRNVLDARV
jgi:two-component system cell cycle sensor histidine kinase/response regulator CckA